MRKYLRAFTLAFDQYTANRLDFFLGRLRNIIVLLLLYYIWLAVSAGTGTFSFFTTEELVTYVLLAHTLRSCIFGSRSPRIASEINEGIFSTYLVRPVNHFVLFYFRELAERCILLFSAILESVVFVLIIKPVLVFPSASTQILLFIFSVFLAHILYYTLSYAVSLIAFWSREAMGPRFLFEWFLEFASGAYFPINILSPLYMLMLGSLPFIAVMFIPLMIFIGKINYCDIPTYLAVQGCWILLTGVMTYLIWKKGLKKYTGEGI